MRLTYLELLEAVKEGKQPKKVKVGSIVYSWDGCEYVQNTDTRHSLSDRLPNWTTKAQTTADFIEEVVDILTGEEKEFLKALIKPVRERLVSIKKFLFGDMVLARLKISGSIGGEEMNFMIDAPIAKYMGEAFVGMDAEREYTPEELDL